MIHRQGLYSQQMSVLEFNFWTTTAGIQWETTGKRPFQPPSKSGLKQEVVFADGLRQLHSSSPPPSDSLYHILKWSLLIL